MLRNNKEINYISYMFTSLSHQKYIAVDKYIHPKEALALICAERLIRKTMQFKAG